MGKSGRKKPAGTESPERSEIPEMSENLAGTEPPEAKQLIVDLYGCQVSLIDDIDYMKDVIHRVCGTIGAGIVEECYHKFTPIGISAVAVITTSHISIHTWPEYGYAAVDIFSCQEDIPGGICRLLTGLLKAEQVETRTIVRALHKEREGDNGKSHGVP